MRFLDNPLYHQDIIEAASLPIHWERFENKKILITGATGMIASVIIDIFMYRNREKKQNTKIIAVSRNEGKAKNRFEAYWENPYFTYLQHDVTEPLPEIGEVDYMLHAASNTHPKAYALDPIGTITANVEGTYQLLSYASTHTCERFLFFSSVEIYGENNGDIDKFGEKDLGYIDCNTVRAGYPESKRLGEALCNAFSAQLGQDFVIGRFSRVYGPTMAASDSKAIAQFIQKAIEGKDIVLKSRGEQLYSYTYVVDAATAAVYLLLYAPKGSAMNVADRSSDIQLKDLAALLASEAGTQVVFELPDEVERAGYSTATKAILETTSIEGLGWRPQTPIAKGIHKTVMIGREIYLAF